MKSGFTGKRLFEYSAKSYEKEVVKMIREAMLDGDLLATCKLSEEKINIIDDILSEENINLVELVEECPQDFKADCILDEYNLLMIFENIVKLEEQRHTLTGSSIEKLESKKNLFLNLIGEDWSRTIKLDVREEALKLRECNQALCEELKFDDLEAFILYESQLVYKIGSDFYDFSLL